MRNQYKVLSEKYITIKESEKEDILGGLDTVMKLNSIFQPIIDQGKELNRKYAYDEMQDWYDGVIKQIEVYIDPAFSSTKEANIKNSIRHVLYYYTTDMLNKSDQKLFEELIYAMLNDLIINNDLTEVYWSVYDRVKTRLELDRI